MALRYQHRRCSKLSLDDPLSAPLANAVADQTQTATPASLQTGHDAETVSQSRDQGSAVAPLDLSPTGYGGDTCPLPESLEANSMRWSGSQPFESSNVQSSQNPYHTSLQAVLDRREREREEEERREQRGPEGLAGWGGAKHLVQMQKDRFF